MKTLIVPLDFSEESLSGLNMAKILASKTGAEIKMVYVAVSNTKKDPEVVEKEKKMAERNMEDILQKHKMTVDKKIKIEYIIREGQVFKEITALAENHEDPVTVLSTHGSTGFEELFIGGNAYKIVSHSRNPVITVRRSRLSSNIDCIVLPLDITFQTREKVPYTVDLAKVFGSEIHLLTIRLSNLKSIEKKLHQYAAQVIQYFDNQGVSYTVRHLQGSNLTDLTLDYARSVNADLISVMTEQEKSVSNLLLGKFAHQMINKAYIPVMLFPNYHLRIITEEIWTQWTFNP
jgi:nucleotide-binding universal stress UspA family protein